MYNLNKLINLVKYKHNSKPYISNNASTEESSTNKTKKFIFLKKKSYRPQPIVNSINNNQNKTAAIKLTLSASVTLNDLTTTTTTTTTTSPSNSSSSSSSRKSISTSNLTLYKQVEKVDYIQNQQNNSITSEIYTLEQMYTDNDIYGELNDMYTEFIMLNNQKYNQSSLTNINNISSKQKHNDASGTDSCSSCSSCYSSESEDDNEFTTTNRLSKSQMSLNKSIQSNASKVSKLKSILIKRDPLKQRTEELDDTKSISDYFGESISIKKLDEKIRFKLAALKIIAIKLNVSTPAHLSMVETLYDLKMNHLKEEIKENLKQFEKKAQQDQADKTNNINRFLNTTTKLLKSYGLRRRAKSVDAKKDAQEPKLKTIELKDAKENKKKSDDKALKHKNYYLLERDNLERKYENQMRLIQFEILNSINAIELQFQEIKRQRNQNKERNNSKTCKCGCANSNGERVQSNNQGSNIKSKINYSTQVSLQKRIQNRMNKKKQQLKMMKFLSSSSRESLVDVGLSNGVKLISSTDIEKYRNPNSIETMV
jgi:hypothetical protein